MLVVCLSLSASFANAQSRFLKLSGGRNAPAPRRNPGTNDIAAEDATANGLCLEAAAITAIFVQGGPANAVLQYVVTSTPGGIVGLSLSPGGPFGDAVIVQLNTNSIGFGMSDQIFVKGLTAGETVITGESPGFPSPAPLPVTVFQVVTTDFFTLGAPLDANPNQGGGLRIFPGKQTANGPVDRTVRVTAQVMPALPDALLFFKSFDVDDPSSDTKPLDPNGSKGNDNLGEPQTGTLNLLAVPTNVAGIAEVVLTVSMQPGDNFRVAASCFSGYLDGVVADGTALKDADGATLPTTRAAPSDMLTVWRKLHVEADSMGLVQGNAVSGTVTKTKKSSDPFITILTVDQTLENGRFENGGLKLAAQPDSFDVFDNKSKTIEVGPPTGDVAGASFTMVDDDDLDNDDKLDGDLGLNVPQPDLGLIGDSTDNGVCDYSKPNAFGPAYVCPVFDIGTDDFTTFFLNAPADKDGGDVIMFTQFDNRASEDDPNFWTIYLLGAYQSDVDVDGDPNTERMVLGRTEELAGLGSTIFAETIADWARVTGVVFGCSYPAVAAHEIGHNFGGDHPDGGLMGFPCAAATASFSDKTLLKIRAIKNP
jgi:hypothetical protein